MEKKLEADPQWTPKWKRIMLFTIFGAVATWSIISLVTYQFYGLWGPGATLILYVVIIRPITKFVAKKSKEEFDKLEAMEQKMEN